jgi:hypothetical protein
MKDGSRKEGLVIKKEGEVLEYMDSNSHNKEKIAIAEIQKLSRATVIYDFEANPIPNVAIQNQKTMSNTLLYGSGGLVLGSAAGIGLGIALVGGGVDLNPYIPMAVLGLGGAWYFGYIGSESDYEDAIFEVRKQRYDISKKKRDKEIEEEKAKLDQKQKEELDKKIEENKSN